MLNDPKIVRGGVPPYSVRLKQRAFAFLAKHSHLRKKRNTELRSKITDTPFTIISQNCIGGVFYHDLGREFLSPTVNLSFDGPDFIKFVNDLDYYLSLDFTEYETDEVPYPVGHLADIEVRFNHYSTFQEARNKWNERKGRVKYDRIFVIATDRDGMGLPEMMKEFDKITFPKVMFTAKEYPEYDWAVYLPRFKRDFQVGTLTGFCNVRGQRFYEERVDLPHWINHCGEVKRI